MFGLVTEIIHLFKGIVMQTVQTEQCVTYDGGSADEMVEVTVTGFPG